MNSKREWLVELRKQIGFNQQEVAKKVGIPRSTYASYETGRRDPTIENAKAIAEIIGFDWTIFFAQVRRAKTQKTA